TGTAGGPEVQAEAEAAAAPAVKAKRARFRVRSKAKPADLPTPSNGGSLPVPDTTPPPTTATPSTTAPDTTPPPNTGGSPPAPDTTDAADAAEPDLSEFQLSLAGLCTAGGPDPKPAQQAAGGQQTRLSNDAILPSVMTTQPVPQGRKATAGPRNRPRRRTRQPRRPGIGLPATVCLALLAAFFAWVTAEPFWLAVGHSQPGIATATHCTGSGLPRRCLATFTDIDGGIIAEHVPLIGATPAERQVGAAFAARMVNDQGRAAYLDGRRGLRLGWLVGLALILGCGVALGWVSGAARLATRRAKVLGFLASLAAPLALLLGMLAITW
ncbi:MAG: hypothetical protein HKP61_13510, partial [Dactylosporangium sp.]|nr:hypothetical protein [Dactylosporangium sp.]NNJ61931.1 hypothetical protein [Dactylosporangium sp.]